MYDGLYLVLVGYRQYIRRDLGKWGDYIQMCCMSTRRELRRAMEWIKRVRQVLETASCLFGTERKVGDDRMADGSSTRVRARVARFHTAATRARRGNVWAGKALCAGQGKGGRGVACRAGDETVLWRTRAEHTTTDEVARSKSVARTVGVCGTREGCDGGVGSTSRRGCSVNV